MKRKKKKKKLNKQQRHVQSMSQRTRLNNAKPWLEEYVERRLVHAYRSRYGVELLEAISECSA